MGSPPQSHSFTIKSSPGGRFAVLKTLCHVSGAISPGQAAPVNHQFTAIWDTGAQGSVITTGVAAACGLAPTGVSNVLGVHGAKKCFTYLVNIVLPNGVQVRDVRVTEGQLPGGPGGDVLIGMDIITLGDFAVTNKDGNTWFSFRVPSQIGIDYVAEHKAAMNVSLQHGHGRAKAKRKHGKTFGKNK